MFDQTTNTETHQLTVGKIETANGTIKPQLLRDAVKRAVTNFFAQMDGQEAEEVYEMVLSEVEAPLLDIIMQHTRGNQTRAANMLGSDRKSVV